MKEEILFKDIEIKDIDDIDDIDSSQEPKKRFSKEEKVALQGLLGKAINDKDVLTVKKILKNNKLPLNFKYGKYSLATVSISNYNKDIFELLVDNGMKIGNLYQFLSIASKDTQTFSEVFEKLRPDNNTIDNLIRDAFWYGKLGVAKFIIKKHPKVSSSYHLLYAFDHALKKEDKEAFEVFTLSTSSGKETFKAWLKRSVTTFTYNNCLFIQELISSNDKLKDTWDAMFPIDIPRYYGFGVSEVKVKNFLELVCISGAPALMTIISDEKIKKTLANIFDKEPKKLEMLLSHLNLSNSFTMVKSMKKFFSSWKDKDKNMNIGHYLLNISNTKSTADFVYSINKELLMQEDSLGKTPIDSLDEKSRSLITKKLIKRTLNDNKIGLIHKKTKSPKKVM